MSFFLNLFFNPVSMLLNVEPVFDYLRDFLSMEDDLDFLNEALLLIGALLIDSLYSHES